MTDSDRVDSDELWRIEEMDVVMEMYCFVGRHTPFSAVSKAKKQFAQDYGVKYRHVVGKKIEEAPTRSGGAIVLCVKRPKMASHDVIPGV